MPLTEVLAPIIQEIQEFETQGFDLQFLPGGPDCSRRVRGAIAYILSDHPQASDSSGHLGNNATMNCRICLTDKEDRTNFTTDILDHDVTRTNSQAATMRLQMKDALEIKNNSSRRKEQQKMYGLYVDPPILSQVVDVHQMIPPCVGHAMDLGILKVLIVAMIDRIEERNLDIFYTRLKCVPWPSGWSAVSPSSITANGKLSQPMSTVKKLAFASMNLFEGLVPVGLIDLTMRFLHLRGQMMRDGHTCESVKATQQMGQELFTGAVDLARSYGVQLDRPNFHLILECLIRFLPRFMDLRCTLTNRFESHHSINKKLLQSVKYSVGAAPESFALKVRAIEDAMLFLLDGGRYGDNLDLSVGPGVTEIMNPTKSNDFIHSTAALSKISTGS